MMRSALLFLFLISVIPACSRKEPAKVLDKDLMAAMLVEFYLREARMKTANVTVDSAAMIFIHLRKAFAQKSGIDDSTIDLSYNYYLARPQELQDVYTRVIDTLALREQRAFSSNYQ